MLAKKNFTIFAVFLALSCAGPIANDGTYKVVSSEEFDKAFGTKKGVLIDVRTSDEYSRGTIDGAVNIDFYDPKFERKVAALDTSKSAFIFCHSGGRSKKAAQVFIKAGFKEVYDLKGGFSHYHK